MDITGNYDPSLIAIAVVALLVSIGNVLRNRSPLPPGPPGLPFFGNIFDMPQKEAWKTYAKWGKQYNSDIISVKVPGMKIMILNSATIIEDLLAKRSNIYSDRLKSTMLDKIIQINWLTVFMNTTDKWKDHHRLFRREFDTAETTAFHRIHELQAARRLLRRLLNTSDHEEELRLASGDVVLSLTYGITPTDLEHPFIKTPEELASILSGVARGEYWVDVFPFLRFLPKWLPGTNFHKVGEKGRSLAEDMCTKPIKEIHSQVENGTAVSSVASRFLYGLKDSVSMSDIEVNIVFEVLANTYVVGSDTISSALRTFIIAMALYPEIQMKAQKALDDVLEGQRLPEFTDSTSVPYISAIVHEIFRWHPVIPAGMPHVSNQDDTYNGFVISKDSVMIPNSWAVLHDETIFGADTNKFIPERFMTADGTLKAGTSDTDAAFGFGRRICPGRFIARDAVWIIAASILTAYHISEPFDMDGRKLTDESPIEYTNSILSSPPHMKVSFEPRIPESMIHEACE